MRQSKRFSLLAPEWLIDVTPHASGTLRSKGEDACRPCNDVRERRQHRNAREEHAPVAAAVVRIVDLLRYTIPQMHVAVPNSRGLHVHIAPIVQPLAPALPNHVAPPTTHLVLNHDPSLPAHALTGLSFGSEEVWLWASIRCPPAGVST